MLQVYRRKICLRKNLRQMDFPTPTPQDLRARYKREERRDRIDLDTSSSPCYLIFSDIQKFPFHKKLFSCSNPEIKIIIKTKSVML